VKLFIDECLSPVLASRLNSGGEHDAMHPRDYGRLGDPDHVVLQRCLDESRTIVTENARDFRKLVGGTSLHPGLIILPAVGREASWDLLNLVIAEISRAGDPGLVMINRVAEISESGQVMIYELPAPRSI
jgi:predicted nuclease of predicted toxin-antitoxin system